MLFNSLDFFIFYGVVFGLYWALGLRGRQLLLLVASLFFYMYWNPWYVSLLLLSTFVNYLVARLLGNTGSPPSRKLLVTGGVAVNLIILGVFKYYNFFLESLDLVGLRPGLLSDSRLLLPLGISFFTFQSMSYSIDVYRRKLEPERSFWKVLLYISFFPQLVAGPIERATNLLPQLAVKHRFDWENFYVGSRRVLDGFIKKTVIADNLAPLVNQAYGAPADHSGITLLLATYAFSIQIFCDFSGYSDIAIGVARMLGFRFRENFDAPYVSRSIQEFWRRWHISLSTWLRDYLYISLGGNRKGSFNTYRNLAITMLLGGLWHGASFHFVAWGAIHGIWLGLERFLTRLHSAGTSFKPASGLAGRRLTSPIRTLLVFHGVCLSWVFFRAQTLGDAGLVLGRVLTMADGASFPLFDGSKKLLVLGLGCLYFLLASEARRRSWLWWIAGLLGILLVVLFGATSDEFIYFVF